MTMGERIKELRKQHRMSMEELGRHLGVGKTAIYKYENGEVENLPRSSIEKMAIIFGVSPSYLMCFDQWDENAEALSDEVMLYNRIQAKWGKEAFNLMMNFVQLNDEGKKALISLAEDFASLDKYRL